ncbi:MAG: OsmC family protein [Alphaproteobacteria bacterium]
MQQAVVQEETLFGYRAAPPDALPAFANGGDDKISVRVLSRALGGMQKEGIVQYGPTGSVWRLVCDEGPWLLGRDLAPFPLAFFTTGMLSHFASEFATLAVREGVDVGALKIQLDNKYLMNGSAVRGTMKADSLPSSFVVGYAGGADRDRIRDIAVLALGASSADAVMRVPMANEFSISRNGAPIPTGELRRTAVPPEPDPMALFDVVRPDDGRLAAEDVTSKLQSAKLVHGVEGGVGSTMTDEHKRMVHVRATLTWRDDAIKETRIQIFQPIGSVFRILSDDSARFGGQERHPPGLALMAAGVAFCYMTQISRYAQVVKQSLKTYRIVQDMRFDVPGASAGTGVAPGIAPVITHVHVETDEDEDTTRKLVQMGEQTCYLHAAMNGAFKSKVRVVHGTAGDYDDE